MTTVTCTCSVTCAATNTTVRYTHRMATTETQLPEPYHEINTARSWQRTTYMPVNDDMQPLTYWPVLLYKQLGKAVEFIVARQEAWSRASARTRFVNLAATAVAGVESTQRRALHVIHDSSYASHSRAVLAQVIAERARQDTKFGRTRDMPMLEWVCVIGEEIGEAASDAHEIADGRLPKALGLGRFAVELVQTAAVAGNIIEHMDRSDV